MGQSIHYTTIHMKENGVVILLVLGTIEKYLLTRTPLVIHAVDVLQLFYVYV